MSKCLYYFLLILLLLTSCTTAHKREYVLPPWIETGKDIRYPANFYITDSGEGNTKESADDAAINNIAKRIKVNIESMFSAVIEERRRNDKFDSSHEIKSIVITTTDIKELSGLSFERYVDEKGKHHSFAALNKKKASNGLEREIKESHEITRKYFEIAEGERGKGEIAGAIHNYVKAIAEFKRIRPRENILYAIAGKGIKNEISLIDVERKLAEVLSKIKVSVEINVNNIGMNLKSNSVASMITEGLANSGFNVVSSEILPDADVSIKIKGEVNSSKKGEMDGIVYAYSNANITILDDKKGVVIKAINIKPALYRDDKGYDTKGSGATPESAGLNSIKKIGSIIKAEVVKAFNENFMGKGGD